MTEEEEFLFEEGSVSVRISRLRGTGDAAPYPLGAAQWRRAMHLLGRYGERECLVRMDAKAVGAIERGDLTSCLAWRDLMVAVHMFCADAPGSGMNWH